MAQAIKKSKATKKKISKNRKVKKNAFLQASRSFDAVTENLAVSHSTTDSDLLDYFFKVGSYRGRDESAVHGDMAKIWNEDKLTALKILFYLRMITRKTTGGFFESEKVQRGLGAKDEFIKGLKYFEMIAPETLYKNLWLVPVVGSWKDLWYDSPVTNYSFYVNTDEVYQLVRRGMQNDYDRQLIAKYLPRIRSKKNVKSERHERMNEFARGFCKFMKWSEKDYRHFKSNPKNTAHLWQRQMCGNLWDSINFGKISGKALFNLTFQKGKDNKTTFERHNLTDKYINWIKKQPVAKFTGYIYELFSKISDNPSLVERITADKQFDGLIATAKKDTTEGLQGNIWCALDTSSSMTDIVTQDISAYAICVSLGIFFSTLNEGAFKDHVVMFDDHSTIMKLSGTFTDKVNQIKSTNTARGSTNFQSVIDEIVRVRKSNPSIPVEEYPKTLLVVSDMQFNPTNGNLETNYQSAMRKLKKVGLPDIKIIWWSVIGKPTVRAKDFVNKASDTGVAMLSGFDGSVVSLILGGEQEVVDEKTGKKRQLTPYENMMKALNQEALNQIEL